MQILFEYGEEHGVVTKGLGLLPGAVTRLAAQRVPHMGWNTVVAPTGTRLFAGVEAGTRFYFLHSFAAAPAQRAGRGRADGAGDAVGGAGGHRAPCLTP